MKQNIIITSLSVFILLSVSFSDTSAQSALDQDSIIKKIADLKEENKVKALLAGVWLGEKEIVTIALGESMTDVPATTDMHFRIGGVSELFLGTLLMILADEGKINLDDKISGWLPDLPEADKVTPGMLIKNTAGYKDYVLDSAFIDLAVTEPFRSFSHEDLIAYSVKDGELNFQPGTKQQYSHTEFTILADVITRATGKSMPELYEEYIFRPLGLDQTGYSINQELPSPVLHSFSSDRAVYEDATYWNPSWSGDSGPLYSTLNDLYRWSQAFGKGKLLSAGSFKELVSSPGVTLNPDIYFASGFAVSSGWYFQNPSFNGYSGAFGYNPSKDLTVIIYSTQSEDRSSGARSFPMMRELIKMISPDAVIKF
ncbi:MAG: beta-lactamase family protein [Bacteroidetes bacterium]|nr:beta-lactamase family protein [Bacteroidota bacterium]